MLDPLEVTKTVSFEEIEDNDTTAESSESRAVKSLLKPSLKPSVCESLHEDDGSKPRVEQSATRAIAASDECSPKSDSSLIHPDLEPEAMPVLPAGVSSKRKKSALSISSMRSTFALTGLRTSDLGKSTREAKDSPSCSECFPRSFPRAHAICVYIIFPLWFLILLSVGGGFWLASYEAPYEIEENDELLRNMFLQQELDGSTNVALDFLLDLPSTCFENYLKEQSIRDTNHTLMNVVTVTNGEDLPSLGLLEATSNTLNQILQSMALCTANSETVAEQLNLLRDAIEDRMITGHLQFNWIRCWNQTELGSNPPLSPSEEHLAAAANQTEFYTEMWEADRARLTAKYLEEMSDATPGAILAARRRAINDASGGEFCRSNSAGTAWFWFTVMTTVGYGNQAPVTLPGRAMVSSLGFLSILAFGGILVNAGQVVAILMDDALKRKKLMPSPVLGTFFWAGVTTGWIFAIGAITRRWWDTRLEDFEYEWWDSVWFAYISTTTVGLGDFFLQPEVIFLPDVATFSLLFLTGFVFLATFLDKLATVLGTFFPDVSENLTARVSRTRLFYNDDGELKLTDERQLKALKDLNENKPEGFRSIALLQEENDLLRKLMERNARALKRLIDSNAREREKLLAEGERAAESLDFAWRLKHVIRPRKGSSHSHTSPDDATL